MCAKAEIISESNILAANHKSEQMNMPGTSIALIHSPNSESLSHDSSSITINNDGYVHESDPEEAIVESRELRMYLKPKCKYCGRTFSRKDNLHRHLKSKNCFKVKDFKCNKCGETFTTLYSLDRHAKSGVCSKILCKECFSKLCLECKNKFHHVNNQREIIKYQIVDNQVINSSNSDLICHDCGTKFETKSGHKQHLKERWNNIKKGCLQNEEIKCKPCGKSFKSKLSLDRHIKSRVCSRLPCSECHRNIKECTKCHKIFIYKKSFKFFQIGSPFSDKLIYRND